MSGEDEAAEEAVSAEEHQPTGTLLIALGFLLVTAAVWTFTYVVLLERG